eukprot:1747847-Amphidinium_carterae.2
MIHMWLGLGLPDRVGLLSLLPEVLASVVAVAGEAVLPDLQCKTGAREQTAHCHMITRALPQRHQYKLHTSPIHVAELHSFLTILTE